MTEKIAFQILEPNKLVNAVIPVVDEICDTIGSSYRNMGAVGWRLDEKYASANPLGLAVILCLLDTPEAEYYFRFRHQALQRADGKNIGHIRDADIMLDGIRTILTYINKTNPTNGAYTDKIEFSES